MVDASTRVLAKTLFGRELRAELGVWISRRSGERFFLQEAQHAMSAYGGAASATKDEVDRLVHVDMLDRAPDGRRVYFTPTDHPGWKIFEAAGAVLELD
jgi:hypothetical protein